MTKAEEASDLHAEAGQITGRGLRCAVAADKARADDAGERMLDHELDHRGQRVWTDDGVAVEEQCKLPAAGAQALVACRCEAEVGIVRDDANVGEPLPNHLRAAVCRRVVDHYELRVETLPSLRLPNLDTARAGRECLR